MNREGSLSYFCSMEEPGSEHIFSKKVVFRPVLNVFIDFILKITYNKNVLNKRRI